MRHTVIAVSNSTDLLHIEIGRPLDHAVRATEDGFAQNGLVDCGTHRCFGVILRPGAGGGRSR